MGRHGPVADDEHLGNLEIGQSLGCKREHLELAASQRADVCGVQADHAGQLVVSPARHDTNFVPLVIVGPHERTPRSTH